MKKNILGLVLARKGSKSFKNKNIKKIKGFTLIEWALFAAIESKHISDIVLSSDYSKTQLGKFSSNFLQKRPKNLCLDHTTSYETIKYVLKKLNNYYDYVVLLEPPCIFRNGKLIDLCINKILNTNCDSLTTLKKLDDVHPIRIKKINNKNLVSNFIGNEPKKGLPRQKQKNAYVRDTAIYIFKTHNFKNSKNGLYGKKQFGLIQKKLSINIDSELEYFMTKTIVDNRKFKNKILLPKIGISLSRLK